MKLLLAALLLSSPLVGQIPESPPMSKVDFGLALADTTVRMFDVASTITTQTNPCKCVFESDPISPDGHHPKELLGFQLAVSAGVIESSRFMARHHHKWIGRGIVLVDIGLEAYAVHSNMALKVASPTVVVTGFTH